MQKEFQHPSIPTKISEKIIYDTYCDNYDSIHYLFVEFQFSWLQQAYKALKDIDKYYILIYLYKENFTELNEIFKVKSYEEFYFNPRFELDKINIIQIAKKLRLSKETARRKILELEEDGILIKNKKSIAVTLKAGLLQKPVNTINSFSKILQYVSWLLYKEKKVGKYYEKDFFIKKIKQRFTQILAIFLEYQIEYLLTRKTLVNNDIEMWFIYGSVLYNQIRYLEDNQISVPLIDEDRSGRKKYKILKVSNRFDEHVADFSIDYVKIKDLALKEKQLRVIQDWMEGKIEDTYVNVNTDNRYCNFVYNWIKE